MLPLKKQIPHILERKRESKNAAKWLTKRLRAARRVLPGLTEITELLRN